MRLQLIFTIALITIAHSTFSQTLKETQNYIINVISENNKDYVEYEFKRNKLILWRKPYLATFEEEIYFTRPANNRCF